LELSVADLAVRAGHPHALFRPEHLDIEVNGGARTVDGEVRDHSRVFVGNGLYLGHGRLLGVAANLARATDKAKTASGGSTSGNVAHTPAVDVHQFIERPPPGRTQCPLRPAERD